MSYEIKKDFIPGLPKTPYRKGASAYEGVVAHSTATPEATCEKEMIYFKREWQNRQAFPHFFVDWTSVVQCADTDYKAWAAGKGNPRFVHVELCETKDTDKFEESYKRYVWLLAKILRDKNLGATSGVTLVSHAWVSENLGGTDHMDPIDYLKSHGITWTQLVEDVKAAYDSKNGWVKEGNKWYYYKNNEFVKNDWAQDKAKKWFYLGADGVMVVDKWVKWKDKWYCLDKDGAMLANTVVKYKGEWYFLQKDGSMLTDGRINVTLNVNEKGELHP